MWKIAARAFVVPSGPLKDPKPTPSHAEEAALPDSSPPAERPPPAPPPPAPPPPEARIDLPPARALPSEKDGFLPGLLPDLPQREQIQETLSGSFLLLSLRRAFRLNIKPNEVLETERKALAESAAHITEPEHQAFLAWRRSVLLIVVVAFVPLTILRFIEAFEQSAMTDAMRGFLLIPAFAEALLLLVASWQLFRWTQWRSQRRVLFIAWALYFIAPNLVFLYPFQTAYEGVAAATLRKVAQLGDLQISAKVRKDAQLAIGLFFGLKATLLLAPKAISLMPGLIRASIVTKLQFPGASAPGYLILISAPLYALFAFMIVILPYQVTASPWFVTGLFGIMVAQIFVALAGLKLITPLTHSEAQHRIHRSWLAYISLLLGAAAVLVAGLFDFVRVIGFSLASIGSAILSFVGNVLLLTLIGTDAIIANLRRLAEIRQRDQAREALRAETEAKVRVFCQ